MAAIVVDKENGVCARMSGGHELLLERIADQVPVRGHDGVGPHESCEGDVERAVAEVQPEVSAAGLGGVPALPRRDRPKNGAVGVEVAVDAITRQHVHDAILGAGILVRPARLVGKPVIVTVSEPVVTAGVDGVVGVVLELPPPPPATSPVSTRGASGIRQARSRMAQGYPSDATVSKLRAHAISSSFTKCPMPG